MEVLKFIHENNNWREILSAKPFCIYIIEQEPYIMLKYNQMKSDLSNNIVQECRGLILEKHHSVNSELKCNETYIPVCIPFFKFFNFEEINAAQIDWTTAKVIEKVDGSIIKLWYSAGLWHLSTNGVIDAFESDLTTDLAPVNNFGDLFMMAFGETNLQWLCEQLNFSQKITYIFELVSPWQRQIVYYEETEVYLIGARITETQQELNPEEHFFNINNGVNKEIIQKLKFPKTYSLKTLEDCLSAVEIMGFDEEGFVVVDKNFNRVKIKSPRYIAAHYMRNNEVIRISGILNIVKRNELDEFLTYYPKYTKIFMDVISAKNSVCEDLTTSFSNVLMQENLLENRKEIAHYVHTNIEKRYWSAMFSLLDNKELMSVEWFDKQSEKWQERLIKWKIEQENLTHNT